MNPKNVKTKRIWSYINLVAMSIILVVLVLFCVLLSDAVYDLFHPGLGIELLVMPIVIIAFVAFMIGASSFGGVLAIVNICIAQSRWLKGVSIGFEVLFVALCVFPLPAFLF